MDDTTKILSVSYGNFSCHLEGFDDSVETMKSVVSYFHELAGHDRFMDVEPQAPDLQTLARLTEEQVGAPVEIEGEGNAVSMRMAEVAASEVEDAAQAVEEPMADADIAEAEEPAVDEFDVSEPEEVEVDVAEPEDDLGDPDTIVLNTPEVEETEAAPMDELPADDDSVASKLQRIRAVVDRGEDKAKAAVEETTPAEETFTEDLPDTDQVQTAVPGNPLAQRLAELAKRNAERAAEEAGIALEAEEAGTAAETEYDDDDSALSVEELAELDAEFAAEEAEDEPVVATAEEAEPEQDENIFDDDDFAEIEDDVAALEEEDESDVAADEGPLVLTDATPPADIDETRKAGYDLQDDIADAQREIAEHNENRSKKEDLRETVDANMSRILSQTDEHLAEPEGRRHRDAFAQLKAAVAATEAARQLGDAGATERDKNEVFRDDLGALDAEEAEEAVDAAPVEDTPEPEAPAEAAEKPEEKPAPLAPLKLVSSKPPASSSDAASDRLRKIAAQKESAPAAKSGFAEFARVHSAADLIDLLEAAAAYICFVEAEDDFSRPQVMKKVQSASSTEFSREDGLRAFGKLLRMNRLVKLNNGRFQVAEDTRFRPENQAAQG